MRSTLGSSLSRCQTIRGGLPMACLRAVATSCSRLEPGKTTTAASMVPNPFSQTEETTFSSSIHQVDGVVLDHRIGQELGAHGLDAGLGLGPVGLLQLQLDIFALADIFDAAEAEPAQGMGDGTALGIQDPVLEGDMNLRLHQVIAYRLV